MILFGRGTKQLKQEVKRLEQITATLQRRVSIDEGLKFINNTIALYPEWGIDDYINSYLTTDQVFSVVNMIAETALTVPRYGYIKSQGAEKKTLYALEKLLTSPAYSLKSLSDIKRLQVKSLEDVSDNDAFMKLLEKPNDTQSENDFVLSCLIFYLLKECFIYKNRIPDGSNADKVGELIVIPPQNVILNISRVEPNYLIGYSVTINGRVFKDVPLEDMIHWKRFNPCRWNATAEYYRGLSPLQVLKRVIGRLEAEDDVTTAQLQNGGLPGIIYDDIGPENMNATAQTGLNLKRNAFYEFLNKPENKGAPFFTAGKLGYIPTGLKLADMLVSELGKADFKRICNAYKVSDVLFNNGETSTESNVREQRTSLYTNAVLPLLNSFYTALCNGLADDFPDKKRIIIPDATAIPELQSNFVQLAQTYSNMPGGFSMNELRESFGWDKSAEADAGRLLVKSGYSFLDEMSMEPVDASLL